MASDEISIIHVTREFHDADFFTKVLPTGF